MEGEIVLQTIVGGFCLGLVWSLTWAAMLLIRGAVLTLEGLPLTPPGLWLCVVATAVTAIVASFCAGMVIDESGI